MWLVLTVLLVIIIYIERHSKTSNPFVYQEPKWVCSDEQVHESKVSRFSFGRDKFFSLSHSQPTTTSSLLVIINF